MKVSVPAKIFATSLNLVSLSPTDQSPKAAGTDENALIEDSDSDSSAPLSPDGAFAAAYEGEEYLETRVTVETDIEWDKAAEKRFAELAGREALEEIGVAELIELEHLTVLRRRATAPPATAEQLLAEFRQWRSMNKLVEALQGYLQEVGIDSRFACRS